MGCGGSKNGNNLEVERNPLADAARLESQARLSTESAEADIRARSDQEEVEEAAAIESAIAALMAEGEKAVKEGGLPKHGYLVKCGTVHANWLKRWFVLQNGILAYHTNENKLDFKGRYNLSYCRILEAESHPAKPNHITIAVNGAAPRKFLMRIENEADESECVAWRNAIASWCL